MNIYPLPTRITIESLNDEDRELLSETIQSLAKCPVSRVLSGVEQTAMAIERSDLTDGVFHLTFSDLVIGLVQSKTFESGRAYLAIRRGGPRRLLQAVAQIAAPTVPAKFCTSPNVAPIRAGSDRPRNDE